MLYMVEMTVKVPAGVEPARLEELKKAETARFQELHRSGSWPHLWRVVGKYANVSILDVRDNAELHDILSSLPLFPFMEVKVTALCRHPSLPDSEMQ